MKAVFGSQDVWEIIEWGDIESVEIDGGFSQIQRNSLRDSRKRETRRLGLDDDAFGKISEVETTTREVWKKLQTLYKRTNPTKKVHFKLCI